MADPVPVEAAQTLAENVGTQVIDAAVGLAPIAVPFVLTVAAIRWALRKFDVGGTASISGPAYMRDDDHISKAARNFSAADYARARNRY